MSGSLDLANIREAAMNPPLGTAASYEQMLAEQLEQAAREERQMLRQQQLQRALDHSGIYNVGRMMLPQDVGELALSAAMTPGIRAGMRAALAALGGMTTEPSDAEGALLPRRVWELLARPTQPSEVRTQAAQMLEALPQAQDMLMQHNPAYGVRINAGQFYGQAADAPQLRAASENFASVAPSIFRETAWMPDPQVGWIGLVAPDRPRDLRNFDATGKRVAESGQFETHRLADIVDDPVLAAVGAEPTSGLDAVARPGMRWNNINLEFEPYSPDLDYLGYFDTEPLTINVAQRPALHGRTVARGTLAHELEHWIQAITGRPRGTNLERVSKANPWSLLDEYRDIYGYRTVDNPELHRLMRNMQSGEWYADIVSRIDQAWADNLPYGPDMRSAAFSVDFPDFRIQGGF